MGAGDVLKKQDLGRRSDGSVGKGPWWLLSPASSRSLCVRVCELLMSPQAPSFPAPDAAV